jgi:hypothetical protein
MQLEECDQHSTLYLKRSMINHSLWIVIKNVRKYKIAFENDGRQFISFDKRSASS